MKQPPQYVYNMVLHGLLEGRFYFVPKARILEGGMFQVVGKKIDITDSIRPYLLKKYRSK